MKTKIEIFGDKLTDTSSLARSSFSESSGESNGDIIEDIVDQIQDKTTKNTKNTLKIKLGDFILVKFVAQPRDQYYIGFVMSTEAETEAVAEQDAIDKEKDGTTYSCKFLRKVSDKTFIFPQIDDISIIESKSVKCILNQPVIDRREKYVFKDDIIQKYYLH